MLTNNKFSDMEIDEIIRDIFGPEVFLEPNDTKFSKENEKSSRYF